MRTYRAAIPDVKHSAISQPPLVGDGWPRVIGRHIREIDPSGGRLLGPVMAPLASVADFRVLTVGSVLCFLLGRHWRPFYVLSAAAGLGAAWRAWSAFRGTNRV